MQQAASSRAEDDWTSILGISEREAKLPPAKSRHRNLVIGVCVGGCAVLGGLLIPFVSPGFRRIALPYLPATDRQVQLVSAVLAHTKPKVELSNGFVDPFGRVAETPYDYVDLLTCKQIPASVSTAIWERRRLIDLGSGDGRLVIAAAQHGLSATGVELNWWLVMWSRWRSFMTGRETYRLTRFIRKDIFKTDLRQYEVIVLFGVTGMMKLIQDKLSQEMQDNALFIACRFPLPGRQAFISLGSGVDTVWVYRKCDL